MCTVTLSFLLSLSLSLSLSARSYTASLPRREVVLVDSLRQDWENLTQLADTTRQQLLHEHRHIHERETDKQVRIYTYHTCMCVVSIHVHGVFITPACTLST